MTVPDIQYPFDTKNFGDRHRRTLNKLILDFVETLHRLNVGYADTQWYQRIMTMKALADFGDINSTQITTAFLPLLGVEASRGHSGLYEALISQVPHLSNFHSVKDGA